MIRRTDVTVVEIGDKHPIPRVVPGYVVDGAAGVLAVTPRLRADDQSVLYVVTHVPTGRKLPLLGGDTIEQAIEEARHFYRQATLEDIDLLSITLGLREAIPKLKAIAAGIAARRRPPGSQPPGG